MKCREIINIIEKSYGKEYALEWDNIGLLVGRADREVRTIYVALDATDTVIEHAIEAKTDMLVTHHPMIFGSIKSVSDEDFLGNKIINMIENGISCYAAHTNYDVVGMADLAGEIMDMEKAEPLEVTDEASCLGIGKIADLKNPVTLHEYAELVKTKFKLENVKIFGNLDAVIKRAAISPGAGNSMTAEAAAKCAQVLVTGDISHHQGIDSVDQGLNIIDAGHYGIEYIFIKDMADFLSNNTKDVKIICEPIDHPFTVI